MTSHTDTQGEQEALRAAILSFDLSRADTCTDAVTGKITKDEADSQLERDVSDLIGIIEAHTSQAIELASVRARIAEANALRDDQVGYVRAVSGHVRNSNGIKGAGYLNQAKQTIEWLDKRIASLEAQLTQLEGKQS